MAAYGRMREASPGKDSVTGHWELMGLVLDRPFPTFPHGFPARRPARVRGPDRPPDDGQRRRLGHRDHGSLRRRAHADGRANRLHLGRQRVPDPRPRGRHPDRGAVRDLSGGLRAGRRRDGRRPRHRAAVRRDARRFQADGQPARLRGAAASRRRCSIALVAAGVPVHAVGKIHDLFAGRGTTTTRSTASDDDGMDAVEALVGSRRPRPDLRQPRGLRHASTAIATTSPATPATSSASTRGSPSCCRRLRPDDLLVITADHGNDPTTPSTDHSREHVPLLVLGAGARPVPLGDRATFADLGQTLAEVFAVAPLAHGTSFRRELWG